jgi:hypothetical protein
MALADSLIKVADKLLTRFNVTDRKVYKRTFTRTGGDALIGRPGSVTSRDVALDPPPAVQLITSSYLSMAVGANGLVQIGDYLMTVSPNALSRADLQNPNIALVFSPGPSEEELVITTFNPVMANGKDVVFEVVARSNKR